MDEQELKAIKGFIQSAKENCIHIFNIGPSGSLHVGHLNNLVKAYEELVEESMEENGFSWGVKHEHKPEGMG